MEQASETNAALSQMLKAIPRQLQEVPAKHRSLKQQISEIHGLMFSPAD